jgi:hypothetical protein
MIHLAHLSQVDCQNGIRPKLLENNNLQFDAGLFSSHLDHFVHTHRRRKLWKNVRTGLTNPTCACQNYGGTLPANPVSGRKPGSGESSETQRYYSCQVKSAGT